MSPNDPVNSPSSASGSSSRSPSEVYDVKKDTTNTTPISRSSTSSPALAITNDNNSVAPNNAQAHSFWSDNINIERNILVREYPQLDRKLLGNFISNVLQRIGQNQDKEYPNDPDDEWQTSLLSELSGMRQYDDEFRIFVDFVSRVIRRGSTTGQQPSNAPYRPSTIPSQKTPPHEPLLPPPPLPPPPPPPPSSSYERVCIERPSLDRPSLERPSHERPSQDRLPPITSLPEHTPALAATYITSLPEHTPSLIATYPSLTATYYGRSGTDPHLFSLEPTPIRAEFSPYLTRPVQNRPAAAAYNYTPVAPPLIPSKRPADEFAIKREEGNGIIVGDKPTEGRSLACMRCRRKKTRCNHARPTCSRCAHSGFDCEYPDPLPKPTDMASSIAKLQGQLHMLSSRMLAVEKKD